MRDPGDEDFSSQSLCGEDIWLGVELPTVGAAA
jgi:hypothetical protein